LYLILFETTMNCYSVDEAKQKEAEEAKESVAVAVKAALAKLDAKKV